MIALRVEDMGEEHIRILCKPLAKYFILGLEVVPEYPISLEKINISLTVKWFLENCGIMGDRLTSLFHFTATQAYKVLLWWISMLTTIDKI